MALPTGGAVYRALNESIKAASAAGELDIVKHGATIASARKVARLMDEPGWPIIADGRFDNVSPALFLKYCQALGFTPEESKGEKKAAPSKLAALKGDAGRFKLVSHG